MKQSYACGVELALDVLGGKWRAVVLARIEESSQRYAELRRALPRMSEKMLTQRLRELVDSGLIARANGAYVLTSRGETVRRVLQEMESWGRAIAPELGVRVEG